MIIGFKQCFYALVLCGWSFLDDKGFATMAYPAGSQGDVKTAVQFPNENTASANNLSTAYVVPASEGVWRITEIAGNESVQEGESIGLRSGGWTKEKKVIQETLEGWLNSGAISKDAFVPYRANSFVIEQKGNTSEEWKKYLIRTPPFDHSPQRRIWLEDRRPRPFNYFRQLETSRKFWRSNKNT